MKMNKKMGIILSVLVIFILTGVIITLMVINANKSNNTNNTNNLDTDEVNALDDEIIADTNKAEEVYNSLMNGCEGAYILNINAGETTETNSVDSNTCNSSYTSKLTGYNMDDGLSLYVGVLKNDGVNVYNVSGNLLGSYSVESIDDYFNSTTTYVYKYTKNDTGYSLVSISNLEME